MFSYRAFPHRSCAKWTFATLHGRPYIEYCLVKCRPVACIVVVSDPVVAEELATRYFAQWSCMLDSKVQLAWPKCIVSSILHSVSDERLQCTFQTAYGFVLPACIHLSCLV
jgi:hypothetical protein